MDTYYVVGEVGFEYNDEIYYRGQGGGSTPIRLFKSKEAAEAERLILTRDHFKKGGDYNSLMCYGYDNKEIFKDEYTARMMVNKYMPDNADEDWEWDFDFSPMFNTMTWEDFTKFEKALYIKFYEVYEVALSSEDPSTKMIDPKIERKHIVFTGFRDTDLEAAAMKQGYEIGSSVSKKTAYLVAEDPTETTGKLSKARELGTPIITETQLRKILKLR